MSMDLAEIYSQPYTAPSSIDLPALERKKKEALSKLYCTGSSAMLLDGSDPRVASIKLYAESAIFYAEMKMSLNFSPYEIYKHAEESESKLRARITEYENSKAENEQKATDYSRISGQFDAKLGNAKSNSKPLDFSRGSDEKYAPWNGPGINETRLIFPPKNELVSCIKKSAISLEGNNPYLSDTKVVDTVAGALAGKEMVGLDMKDKVLRKVGEIREKGDLARVPPHRLENLDSLASMYDAFGKCARNVHEPLESSQGNQRPVITQSPEEKSKDDLARDIARMVMLSDLAY